MPRVHAHWRHPRKLAATVALLVSSATSAAATAIKTGEIPPLVELAGESGGRIDGKPWSSDRLKGKLHVLFYVDPDEKGVNEALEHALAAANFPADKFATVAVINLAATWLPNAAIASALAGKQKEFPRVVYVKDAKKTLVRSWGVADDAYAVIIFDKHGKVLHTKDGAYSPAETKELIELIKTQLDQVS